MAERKSTPDILAEILAGPPASSDPVQENNPAAHSPERMPAESPVLTQPRRKQPMPPLPAPSTAAVPKPAARTTAGAGWEYLVISFQEHRGWRARFRDGIELTDWTSGPLLHESLGQLAEDGWELVTATSGEALYGAADKRQLYFRRRR